MERILRKIFYRTITKLENRAYAHGQEMTCWNITRDSENGRVTVWEDPWEGTRYLLGVIEDNDATR